MEQLQNENTFLREENHFLIIENQILGKQNQNLIEENFKLKKKVRLYELEIERNHKHKIQRQNINFA
jgi:hypothetical protein